MPITLANDATLIETAIQNARAHKTTVGARQLDHERSKAFALAVMGLEPDWDELQNRYAEVWRAAYNHEMSIL